MEINGVLPAGGSISGKGTSLWNFGERLLVEVIQKDGLNGIIRVKGQDILALLETSTEIGDKFWVKAGGVQEGNLLLIREPLAEQQGEIQAVPQLLMERGLPVNQQIIKLLDTFSSADSENLGSLWGDFQEIMAGNSLFKKVLNTIPEWKELSGENGSEKIVEFLRTLGINYEQRLQQLLKQEPMAKEEEISNLRTTLKYLLLESLQNQDDQNTPEGQDLHGRLVQLLHDFTGQQLWFKTGLLDNAYLMLMLPLLKQGQFFPVKIAIESTRKGSKMDEKHCRIALKMETKHLGEIGIDAFFDENILSLRILSRNDSQLPQLLENVVTETKQNFAKLGFTLTNIVTGDLDKNPEFHSFLRGIRRSGVDVHG
jgi:hypothetical protein